MRKLSYKSFSFGYTFEKNKEVISLISINYFFIIIFIAIVIMVFMDDDSFYLVTYRYPALLLLFILNILFFRLRLLIIPKIVLLYILPFSLLILPALGGLHDNEFYFWLPYVPSGLAIIPHFILRPDKEFHLKTITIGVYLFLVVTIDDYLIFMSKGEDTIIPFVESDRFYINLIPTLIFVFINVALFLLFGQNNNYEKQLTTQKQELEDQNEEMDQTLNRLRETQTHLIQTEKLVSLANLTSGLAHEINNPLNFIASGVEEIRTSILQMKKNEPLSPENQEQLKTHHMKLLEFIQEGVNRTEEIVRKLSTIQHKEEISKRVDIKLSDLLTDSLRYLQETYDYDLRINLKIEDDAQLLCNRSRIRKAIVNVLKNAVEAAQTSRDYSKEIFLIGGTQVREEQKFYTIQIINTGTEIPEENIAQLFDPFFTTKQNKDSVGLGLTETYSIVSAYEGTVGVKNENGKVVFTISLPLVAISS